MNQDEVNATIAFSKNKVAIDNSHMVAIKDIDGTLHIIKCDLEPKLVGTTMTRKDWNKYPIRDKMPDVKPIRSTLQKKEVT